MQKTGFADQLLTPSKQAIFELFDCLEAEKPKDFYSFAIERLGQIKWEEGQAHLAAQTEQIAREIFEIYRADADFRDNNLKNKPIDSGLKDMKKDSLFLDNFPEYDNFQICDWADDSISLVEFVEDPFCQQVRLRSC